MTGKFLDQKMLKVQKPSKDLGFFRFKKLGSQYLLTNDLGEYVFLSENNFTELVKRGGQAKIEQLKQLGEKGFLKKGLDEAGFIKRYAAKNRFLRQGPSLHIIILTLRCNHKCLYCHASAENLKRTELDMNKTTAKAVVETIFNSPSQDLTIEFQGGEPLVNWPVLKFIVDYAQKKNKKAGKNLLITIVSNLSLMDKAKLDWLFKRRVIFCTSLDGPEFLHNKQRIFSDGNSYKNVAEWIRTIRKKYQTIGYRINALTTITKHSLPFWKEIVDSYIELGLPTIFLRVLNPFGLAQKTADQIRYSPQEFIEFYRKSLDYIIELNLRGKKIREGYAVITLQKIFGDADPNFLDLRSPCGAGIGQLAYNFNGDVYTCDEGRMLNRMGDDSFKLGNVLKNSYQEIVSHQVVKSCCIASTLEGLPECFNCAYKPYCGTCPVFNYKEQGNIFPQIPNNERCKIFKGIFDYLFEKLKNKESLKVFHNWLKATTDNKKKLTKT